ncbi:HoxN/HupN/NixA family nickel/cobalt transporter [Arthrobacter sp. SLBN-112]|uniref:HoxN/HupN/NixA family nickel/cobalt transporter n=1 Tax=Arthrobacter sp. SLBN-112 TaxID=2768452 RepID=UPI00115499C4|nr:HoxN/HupN/NixA family nickel/cobalt transporter [Arthrobacter sp. SLBN-112]
MAAVVLLLHLVGWGVLVLGVVPQNLTLGSNGAFGLGIGLGAYLLGMRHAFDVDHIAAIDCTTRKLMGEGLRPVSVGFWFSLGHSSIVFGLCLLLAAGARLLGGQLGDDASSWRDLLGTVGATISGLFLYLLAFLNLVLLIRAGSGFRRLGGGEPEARVPAVASSLLVRLLQPVMRSISRPWQTYVVGLLFGLGFDTAAEVALLVVAGGAAAVELPWYAVLTLPVLFAAGMSLLDSLDGWFMNAAYGWAFSHPRRRLLYNLVLTGFSAAVALGVGTVELLSVVRPDRGAASGALGAIGSIDLAGVGYALVGVFVLAWLAAVCIARVRRGASLLPGRRSAVRAPLTGSTASGESGVPGRALRTVSGTCAAPPAGRRAGPGEGSR